MATRKAQVVEEQVIENVRFYSDADPDQTGPWGLVDCTLSYAFKLAQACKNDHPDRRYWFKAAGKTYRVDKVTGPGSNFESALMTRKAVPKSQLEEDLDMIEKAVGKTAFPIVMQKMVRKAIEDNQKPKMQRKAK